MLHIVIKEIFTCFLCDAVSIREILGLEHDKVVEINGNNYPTLEVSMAFLMMRYYDGYGWYVIQYSLLLKLKI